MSVPGNTISSVFRRPELLAYSGAFFLILAVLHRINPIVPVISGLFKAGDADLIENLMTLLQFITQKDTILYVILFFTASAFIGGPVAAVLLSGFLFTANSAVSGGIRKKSEFIYGLKKYYKKVALVTVKSIFLLFAITVFLMIASVPLMAVLRTAFFSSIMSAVAGVITGILTVFVLLMGSLFCRVYIAFWYSAVINGAARPFAAGKKLADKYFWRVSLGFILFDLIFILFNSGRLYFPDSIYTFAAGCIFNTLFFTLLTLYILSVYSEDRRST